MKLLVQIKHIKNYYKELDSYLKIYNILIITAVFVGVLCYYDSQNILLKSLYSYFFVEIRIILLICLFVAFTCWLMQINFKQMIAMPCVSGVDLVISTLLLTDTFFCLYIFIVEPGRIEKRAISIILFIVLSVLVRTRVVSCKFQNKSEKVKGFVYDLNEIISWKKIDGDQKDPILLEEKDVDYDLLDRSPIVNHLQRMICLCDSNHSYVIGLEGEWGSGKTTILNNVRKNIQNGTDSVCNSCKIIDFDPWLYGSQDALICAIYDTVLDGFGIKFGFKKNKNVKNTLRAAVSSASSAGSIAQTMLFPEKNTVEEMKMVKQHLAKVIEKSGKTYVLIIDNFDRAEPDNIILLFKLMETFFDIPKIIFVLAYDRTRIDEIFITSKKIPQRYLEKIIQQEIKVPPVQKEVLSNIYDKCVSNILRAYCIQEEEISDYSVLRNLISEEVTELRKFKRLINSTFPIAMLEAGDLDRKQLLSIEVIRFLKPELYSEILENRNYYISQNKEIENNNISILINQDQFNVDKQTYFDKVIPEYIDYCEILSELFPYVREYCRFDKYYSIGHTDKRAPIYSAKYFDLYFSYGTNNYLKLRNNVLKVINQINQGDSQNEIYFLLHDALIVQSKDNHREWMEQFQIQLDNISENKKRDVTIAVFFVLNIINSSNNILYPVSARTRAIVIIERLIEKISIEDLLIFSGKIQNNYEHLNDLNQILYWMEKSDRITENELDERKNIIKTQYQKMCERVLYDTINLYQNKYYYRGNIYGLLFGNDNNFDKCKLKEYMSKCISQKYIYRILADVIECSHGKEYSYSMSEEGLEKIFITEEVADRMLAQRKPKNDSEKFVLNVYQQYKKRIKDFSGRYSVTIDHEMDFVL